MTRRDLMSSHINCTPMYVQLLVCMIAIVIGLKTLYNIVLPSKRIQLLKCLKILAYV